MTKSKHLKASGSCGAHHGEILQGRFSCKYQQPVDALVTLNLPNITSQVIVEMTEVPGLLNVEPADRHLALDAARATLAYLGKPEYEGIVKVNSRIPVGYGLGSSTSDTVATIRAVANCFNITFDPVAIAELAPTIEGASDPIMLDWSCRLFAHRAGYELDSIPQKLTGMFILGFLVQSFPVRTLDIPERRYSRKDISKCDELWISLKQAVTRKDVREIGRVARASALLNQQFVPVPDYAQLDAICSLGAVGLQISHSGSVGGFLFDSHEPGLAAKVRATRSALATEGFVPTYEFEI